jgi:predicted permease
VFLTGEPAQDAVEKLPGISERVIDRHEDAARIATIVTAAIGALALGALAVYRRRALPRSVAVFALVGAVGATAFMGYAANLGGQIRHTEITGGSVSGAAGGEVDTREPKER